LREKPSILQLGSYNNKSIDYGEEKDRVANKIEEISEEHNIESFKQQ
jgi:hypothetical protein